MVRILHPRLHQIIRDKVEYIKDKKFQDKDIKINETILIAGSARSGTTWLMDVLNTIEGYSTLFEPLHQDWFPDIKKTGFTDEFYVDPEEEWGMGKEYFESLFSGKIKSTQAHFDIHPKNISNRLLSDKILIKIIRGNKILPWIGNNFDLKGIVYLIRHPCGTIDSQLRSGVYGRPKEYLTENKILDEIKKCDVFDSSHVEQIEGKLRSIESKLAAVWCIDNLIPIKYKGFEDFIFVKYEDLVLKGQDTAENIFSSLGEETPDKALELLSVPSGTSDKSEEEIQEGSKQVKRWEENLSNEQIDDVLDIVKIFDIDKYLQQL